MSKIHFRHIAHNKNPPNGPIDPAILGPRLLPGETVQGFLTAAYKPQRVHTELFNSQSFSRLSLQQLLYVHWKGHDTTNANALFIKKQEGQRHGFV